MFDQPARQQLDSDLPGLGPVTRVRLDEPVRLDALRDYFLRLGAEATLNPDGTLDVQFRAGDEADAQAYLTSWVQAHRVGASVAPADGAPEDRREFEVVPRASGSGQLLRVGDLLVSKGLITEEQLSRALVESRQNGELLGLVLLRHECVFESELARILAEQWTLPYLDLAVIGVDEAAVHRLPYEVGMHFAAVPVRYTDNGVQVAFADPSDQSALDAVREHLGPIEPAVAELKDIRNIWRTAAGEPR